MYPILLCSIVVFAARLRSILRLWARRPDAERLALAIERSLALGDVDEGIAIASASGGASGRVVLAGLRECLQPSARTDAALASALLVELPRLQVGQGTARAITQLATLFGLLGTLLGLSQGFCCVANTDATSRAVMLARGISEAMNCTAFGLLVSMCSLALACVLDARAETLRSELELVGRATLHSLVTHRRSLRWLGARAPMDRPTYRVAA